MRCDGKISMDTLVVERILVLTSRRSKVLSTWQRFSQIKRATTYPPTSAHTLLNHLLDVQVTGKRSLNNPQTSAAKSQQPTS